MKLRSIIEGELHPACLEDLKNQVAAGEKQSELARAFGVSKQRVSHLKKRAVKTEKRRD